MCLKLKLNIGRALTAFTRCTCTLHRLIYGPTAILCDRTRKKNIIWGHWVWGVNYIYNVALDPDALTRVWNSSIGSLQVDNDFDGRSFNISGDYIFSSVVTILRSWHCTMFAHYMLTAHVRTLSDHSSVRWWFKQNSDNHLTTTNMYNNW